MNTTPTHFLYYDPFEEKWTQASLADLTSRNDPETYIIPVYGDTQGERCTWEEWPNIQRVREEELKAKQEEERRKLEAGKPVCYEYEVIEHTEYNGLAPSDYDCQGLKDKLNALAAQGYRLVAACAPTTCQTQSIGAICGIFGDKPSTPISLHGIVAIMERPRK